MEYVWDTKYFDEESLTDAVPLNSGENSSNDEVNEYIAEGGDK